MDPKDYIDIYKRIAHGLKNDFIDEKTGQIWKVRDYLAGRTDGVRVYTLWGRFLGTAYYGHYDKGERSGDGNK